MLSGSQAQAEESTIAALSSGQLPSGVAVVRTSGPAVRALLDMFIGCQPPPRSAWYGTLRLSDGSPLDSGIILFFPAPNSFTGEDCAEFQVHGGRAVVAALLKCITDQPGCRLAEAGEFTRRAFQHGKMDLLRAEAAADIVDAETESQRRFAAESQAAGHSELYGAWRGRVIYALAFIEADLDFSDEGDVPNSVPTEVWCDMAALAAEIQSHLLGFKRAEIVTEGFRVVIVGSPNAGKSSLLNSIAKRKAAIVTAEPGTTRDPIDVVLDLNGSKVIVTDTAGLREAQGEAERIGVAMSMERAQNADLVVEVIAPGTPSASWRDPLALHVATKVDLGGVEGADFATSANTGVGIEALLLEIGRRAYQAGPTPGEIIPWRQRHVQLLDQAVAGILAALEDHALEIQCEELRVAADAIGGIAGHIGVEDLLDAIFSRFCIGK